MVLNGGHGTTEPPVAPPPVVPAAEPEGRADRDGVRRFETDRQGARYGETRLGGVFQNLRGKLQRAVHEKLPVMPPAGTEPAGRTLRDHYGLPRPTGWGRTTA
jgi:hypothetical protein